MHYAKHLYSVCSVQMTSHCGIDLAVLPYTPLTLPFELLTFDLNEFDMGEIPSYLDQSRAVHVNATDIGEVHALIYWFDLYLTPDIKVSTADSKYHFTQAAIIQKEPLEVSTGSSIKVDAVCVNNCLHAKLALVE